MALSVLDGNQSATTLSSVVTGGEHIVAHSVVSLGSNAISNITTAISGSTVCVGNLGLLQSTVATEGLTASGSFIKIGGHTGTSTTGNIAHVSAIGALRVDGSSFTQPVSIASVTIGNTVTIAGTVTANPTGTQTIAGTVTANTGINLGGNLPASLDSGIVPVVLITDEGKSVFEASIPATLQNAIPAGTNRIGVVTIGAGTVTVGGFSSVSVGSSALLAGGLRSASVEPLRLDVGTGYLQVKVESAPSISGTVTLGAGTAQIGSVTASISNSVTIASLPAISGTVTANVPFFNFGEGVSDGAGNLPIYGIQIGYADSISGEFQLVADNKPLPISGTVTANSSNGSLTTRFGSVTTANTAFATSAVTNANRKYLLIQNITTASNVITVGIGFTPTTTQGIQLFAGAGLTFEGSYIPTGAVNLLSSVTASCYTILEA